MTAADAFPASGVFMVSVQNSSESAHREMLERRLQSHAIFRSNWYHQFEPAYCPADKGFL